MLSHNEPTEATTTERIRDKLLNKFDKSDLILSKLSSDDEHDHDADFSHNMSHTQHTMRSITDKDRSRRTSDLVVNHHGRPSKTDSSIVETDTSVLAINRKIDDMRKNKKFWKS